MYKGCSAVTTEDSLFETVAQSWVGVSIVELRTVIERLASVAVHNVNRQGVHLTEYIPIEGVNRLSTARAGGLIAGS